MLLRLAAVLMMSTIGGAPEDVLVLRPGAYATDDVAFVRARTPWNALCREGIGARIVPTVPDQRPPLLHTAGERISLRGCADAVIAMSGSGWKAGPVETAKVAGDAVIFRGKKYIVRRTGAGPVDVRDGQSPMPSSRFVVEFGGRQTLLQEGDPWTEFQLLWAGDLDRDGQLDLAFLQTTGSAHQQTDLPFLFLSSRATPGAPLGAGGIRGIPAVRRLTRLP